MQPLFDLMSTKHSEQPDVSPCSENKSFEGIYSPVQKEPVKFQERKDRANECVLQLSCDISQSRYITHLYIIPFHPSIEVIRKYTKDVINSSLTLSSRIFSWST